MKDQIFIVSIASDEKEYIERRAYAFGLSASAFARKKILATNWKQELKRLQGIQPEVLPRPGRRKKIVPNGDGNHDDGKKTA